MLRRITILLCVLSLSIPIAQATGTVPPAKDITLQQAVAGSWRPAANKARDVYRHPVETLQFFGIQPGMTVIELSPGGGWYTEILAPYLAAHGQLIEAAPPKADKFNAKLKAQPEVFGHISKVISFVPPGQVDLGTPGSADMVLTFRNTHDWLIDSPETLDAVFKAAFEVLKPGGILGIEEHRARPFADARVTAGALHRIPEDYMIAQAIKAGFRLADVSQVNANPNDPEDINVHRLPPDLAGPEEEHAKMKAIGESDRMTLKFIKP